MLFGVPAAAVLAAIGVPWQLAGLAVLPGVIGAAVMLSMLALIPSRAHFFGLWLPGSAIVGAVLFREGGIVGLPAVLLAMRLIGEAANWIARRLGWHGILD